MNVSRQSAMKRRIFLAKVRRFSVGTSNVISMTLRLDSIPLGLLVLGNQVFIFTRDFG